MASVYEVAGTLILSAGNARFKPYGYKRNDSSDTEKPYKKKRVVKIQKSSIDFPLSKAQHEYEMSKRAGHLAIKPPTLVGATSYTVMRKVAGEELFKIIDNDRTSRIILSLDTRIELSRLLLKALKAQVTDKGLIHGDIKPENLIVDIMHNPFSIHIIDYAFSVPIDNPDQTNAGTAAYAPPELFNHPPIKTPKIDVFSMARVIALLWNVDFCSYNLVGQAVINNALNVNLDTLFTCIAGLSGENKNIIKSTLQAMLHADISKRMSLDDAIAAFAKIKRQNPSAQSHNHQAPLQNHSGIAPNQVKFKQIEDVLAEIQLLKMHAEKLTHKVQAKNLLSLANRLELKLTALKKMTAGDVAPCIRECQQLIKDNIADFKPYQNIYYMLTNIALAIIGIGLLNLGLVYPTIGLAGLAVTGNFIFFKQPKLTQVTENLAKALDRIEPSV